MNPRFITAATYKIYIPSAPVQTLTIAAPYYHLALDGLTTPSLVRQFQPYPNAEGGVDQGFRVQPRQLSWKVLIDASSETDLEDKRTQLYRTFRPSEQPLQLEVTRADGSKRTLEIYANGRIEFAESAQVGYSCVATIPLYAPNPIWYYSVASAQSFSLGATSGAANADYLGNWFEYPVIEIVGEFVDLVLTDINGYTIDFTGHTITAGSTYTIDLRPTAKTAVDASGNNVESYLVNPLWTGLALYPGPLAKIGGSLTLNNNAITAAYTSKSAGAAIAVRWYDRYINL